MTIAGSCQTRPCPGAGPRGPGPLPRPPGEPFPPLEPEPSQPNPNRCERQP